MRFDQLLATRLALATLLLAPAALADVDPNAFAPDIRALEWREIGPYRGGRSAAVCEHLSQRGVEGLHNLEGGFGAWTGATETPAND